MHTLLLLAALVGPPAPLPAPDVLGLPATGRSQEHPYEWKTDLLALSLGIGGDLGTTYWARSRGAVEENPLLKDDRVLIGVKVIEIPVVLLWTKHIHNNDPKGAHKVKWILLGIHGLVSAWNIQVALRSP